jgi:flagellar biosynthesis/type III secretory pathway protein FliH
LEAQAEVREAYERELESLKETTRRFAEELEALARMRKAMMDEAEDQMISLCIDVGQRLACEAQMGDTSWVGPVVREAAEALTDTDRAVCRVSSELAGRLDKDRAWPEVQGLVFEIAPDLEALDIVVESRFGRVDASFRERLQHLERAVRERVEKAVTNHSEQEVA